MTKVLLVEDELDLAQQVRDWLEDEHYLVEVAHDGQSACDCLQFYNYDLIVLDWMLPKVDGLTICRQYRERGGSAPILLLTAKGSTEDKELGLDTGADDYLTKPFQLKELSARLRALLRRSGGNFSSLLQCGDVTLDPDSRSVTKAGQNVHLEPKEFNLLEFLLRNKNKTFSADALIRRVWESDSLATTDTLRTYIRALRKKIDTPGADSIITTVHGVGYKIP